MKELTKCLNCGNPLVSHEEVHAVRGGLYCSKSCSIEDIKKDIVTTASEHAAEIYDDEAEVVLAKDILSEDLQDIKITVTCTKTVKMPRNLTAEQAISEVTQMYKEGLIVVEPGYECDSYEVKCELVINENSPYVEGHTLEDIHDE